MLGSKYAILVGLIVCYFVAGSTADGQDRFWGGTSGDWNDLENWSPNDVPNSNGETAILGGTDAYNVTYSNGFGLGGLVFSNPNASLTFSPTTTATILTVVSDFSILGTLNLNSNVDGLDVTLFRAGTITNSATGTINFGGTSISVFTDRQLQANLFVNDGSVNINQNALFNRNGGVYTNNSLINVANGRILEFGASTIQTFNQNGGTFSNQGAFVFSSNDILNFNGGNFTGNAVELSGSILNIGPGSTGTGTFNAFGGAYSGDLAAAQTVNFHATDASTSSTTATTDFTNNGTIQLNSDFDGRDVTLFRDGTIINSATGTISFGGSSFSASTDRQLQANLFVNDGTVNINQNALFNRNGGVHTNNHSFNVAVGRSLEFGASTVQTFNQNGGTFDNQGAFVFSSNDILNFNGGNFAGNAVELSGSILNIGAGSTGTGTFNVFGGAYSGDLAAAQTVNFHATDASTSSTTATTDFTNNGTIQLNSDFDGRDVTLIRAGTIINSATGMIIFGGNSTSTSTDRQLQANLFVNDGTVNINQNALFNRNGGVYTNNHSINVAVGRSLEFGASTVQTFNQNGGAFDNQGTLVFSSNDILNFNGGNFTGNAVDLSGSILNIGAGSSGTGTFNVFGGAYSGDLESAQTVNFHATSAASSITTATADFTNNGTIQLNSDFDGRDVTLARAGTITNAATGMITFGGSSSASSTDRHLNGQLVNSGLIDVIAESTATKIGAAGDHHSNFGTILSRNSASIVTILGSSFTNQAGGTLAGIGEYDFSQPTLTNNGIIAPGLSTGTLTLDGNVVFGSTAELHIEIGGLNQGIDYDFVNAMDNLALHGQLSVNFVGGFQNHVGAVDSFTILSAAGLSGIFFGLADGATFVTDDGYGSFQINYVGNNVVLRNFSAVPEPGPGLALILIAAICSFRRSIRTQST